MTTSRVFFRRESARNIAFWFVFVKIEDCVMEPEYNQKNKNKCTFCLTCCNSPTQLAEHMKSRHPNAAAGQNNSNYALMNRQAHETERSANEMAQKQQSGSWAGVVKTEAAFGQRVLSPLDELLAPYANAKSSLIHLFIRKQASMTQTEIDKISSHWQFNGFSFPPWVIAYFDFTACCRLNHPKGQGCNSGPRVCSSVFKRYCLVAYQ
jgi:hypothetical protein